MTWSQTSAAISLLPGDLVVASQDDGVFRVDPTTGEQTLITIASMRHVSVMADGSIFAEANPAVAAAFTRTQILNGQLPNTSLSRRVTDSFFPDKSGDVIPVSAPFYLLFDEYSETPYGTSHDQPYEYDVHVPLLFFGKWIEPGEYHHAVDMANVTPTICAILGISLPSSRDGRVLEEILR